MEKFTAYAKLLAAASALQNALQEFAECYAEDADALELEEVAERVGLLEDDIALCAGGTCVE